MLNSVQKTVLVTGIATVVLMASQGAFAAEEYGFVRRTLMDLSGVYDNIFSISMETARRLVGL